MAVPPWAVGRHLTTVSLTPMSATVNTGVLVPGVTYTITGLIDELEPEEEVTTEEISPLNSFRENHVSLMIGTRMRVAEILTYPASQANVRGPQLLLVRNTLRAVGYCRIDWTHGGTPNAVLGLYQRLSGPWRGKGKQVQAISFVPVDDGDYNWLTA